MQENSMLFENRYMESLYASFEDPPMGSTLFTYVYTNKGESIFGLTGSVRLLIVKNSNDNT